MIEKFSLEVHAAIDAARRSARSKNSRFVEPEHLLDGLLDVEDGMATRALTALNVPVDQLKVKLDALATTEPAEPGLWPPLGQSVTDLLLSAQTRSRAYFGTEHLLLGLLNPSSIEKQSNRAAEALIECGATFRSVYDKLDELTAPSDARPYKEHRAVPEDPRIGKLLLAPGDELEEEGVRFRLRGVEIWRHELVVIFTRRVLRHGDHQAGIKPKGLDEEAVKGFNAMEPLVVTDDVGTEYKAMEMARYVEKGFDLYEDSWWFRIFDSIPPADAKELQVIWADHLIALSL